MTSLLNQSTTYDPIYALLNADSEDEKDKLTQRWKDNKLQELNFIGIVGALLAGVLTSTGSWPNILPNEKATPWTVRACWFCGIVLALAAVVTAAQQSIRLYRLSCHPQANKVIRRLLSNKGPTCDGKLLPRQIQVLAWQMSGVVLTLSIFAMLGGMFILMWSSTGKSPGSTKEGWWDSEAKLAVTFTVVSVAVGIAYVVLNWTLYSWEGKDDSDQ